MSKSLSRAEMENVLAGLKQLQDQNSRAFELKRAEAVRITGELASIADVAKGLRASIDAVKKELGLPVEDKRQSRKAGPATSPDERDTTFEVMRIVSDHQEQGGIDIDGIDAKLKEKGMTVSSRDYLHTILNRKKNKQKKLIKVDGQWFLTDKGKAEVRMRTE